MNISYSDKVILVTGGTSGIGRAQPSLSPSREGKLSSLAVVKKKAPVWSSRLPTGVALRNLFERMFPMMQMSKRRSISFYLPTAASISLSIMPGVEQTGPFDQISREQYDSTFDTNVWGVLNSMKQKIAAMLRNGGGAIVNNSSVDASL